ncbi:MAG: hypothetical protein AUH42_06765 [Gemmatimonadetes bacterium 13_1_40CM_70_11]|nr:MAG: hypothetical protein AUH42_06765 [Gemmatimonadetes bacterium 13_1_40CM_70_11]
MVHAGREHQGRGRSRPAAPRVLPVISCRTLGPVEVLVDGAAAPSELLWRKHLALLVYLARSPKRTRAREHLIGLLWADKPENAARHSLNEAMRVLRRSAGESSLNTDGGQVRLAPDAVEVDTDRFEALATAGDWQGATALVTGEFLEGFGIPDASTFEDWLTAERLAWRQRSVTALQRRIGQLLDRGDAASAVELAQRALALDPTSDAAVRALMRGLAVSGDRAGALERYDAFVGRLRSEVGTAPDAETQALAERVRRERTWRLPAAAATPVPVGAESRRAPLCGRGAELAPLLKAWARCRAEREAMLAVIVGDPGTGKTRLAEEVVARARLDGAVVATVRVVTADAGEADSGILGLARGGLLDAPGISAAPAAALAAFAAHLSEWADRFPGAAREPNPAPLGQALRAVLRAACQEQPVLLVLDDAQWLDRESLLALEAALRDLAPAPLGVLLTAAPQPLRQELDDLRSHLGRDLRGAVVQLAPLAPAELRELARWGLPSYSEVELDRVTRRIATDSAGLPLLAVELLHAVALGLDLREARGGAAWPEPFKTLDQTLPSGLPDAVVAAIRVGFHRLSAGAQSALQAAAVQQEGEGGEERISRERLAPATGLSGGALDAALDELEWQRWLTAEGRGYAFVARIVREVVARDLVTEGQRRRIREAASR